jgi:hypothetical protein
LPADFRYPDWMIRSRPVYRAGGDHERSLAPGHILTRFALNAVAVEGPRGALTFATVAESEGQRNAIYCKCPEQPR